MPQAKKRYHVVRKQQADLKALLRALVSGYLLYLAWKLAGASDPGFSQMARCLAGGLFAAAAAVFGLFTWKRYQADRKNALLTPEEEAALEREGNGGSGS